MASILNHFNKTRISRFQSYCNDPDLVLELKNLIVVFADTLQVGIIFAIQLKFIEPNLNFK